MRKFFDSILGVPTTGNLLEREKFQIAFDQISAIEQEMAKEMKERFLLSDLLLLLQQKGNVNATSNVYGDEGDEEIKAPLVYASLIGNSIITSILLSAGSRNQIAEAVNIAVRMGHKEIVNNLLESLDDKMINYLAHDESLNKMIVHVVLSTEGGANVNKIMSKINPETFIFPRAILRFLGITFPRQYWQFNPLFSRDDFTPNSGLTIFLAAIGDGETKKIIFDKFPEFLTKRKLIKAVSLLQSLNAELIEEFRGREEQNPELSAARLLARFALIDYYDKGICVHITAIEKAVGNPDSEEIKAGIGTPFVGDEREILRRALISLNTQRKVGYEEKETFYHPFISPLLNSLLEAPQLRGQMGQESSPFSSVRRPSVERLSSGENREQQKS
jgi:hypothetical protein